MDYEYSYSAGGGIFTGIWIIIWLILAVLMIVGLWKTFSKAGLPGWAAIIPFYNQYNVVKMSNRPVWFFWAMLGCSLFMWIPLVNFILIIAVIVLWVFIALDIAANFGQGTGFAILLIIFPGIMFLVLGFGSAQFNRIAAPGSAGFGAPPMPAGGSYASAPPPAPPAGGYAAPAAPPAPPAAPVTPAVAPAAPVTPAQTTTPSVPVTPAETAATDAADAGPEAPAAPETPPAPPAGSPPPPPPLA